MGLEQGQSSQSLEYWLSSIESIWRETPEFNVPENFRHLAVICDGNRRSAIEKGLEPHLGHKLGTEVIKGIMQACRGWGIKHLTFWTWSTENWKRDAVQKNFVMNLAEEGLKQKEAIDTLIENRTRFMHLGRKDRLPPTLRLTIENLERITSGFNERFVNLALDYGGLDELSRAYARMLRDSISLEVVTANPDIIFHYLDTAGQPNPDLVVRTGGTIDEIPHTSGFMPLQTAYSGWVFMKDLFPDLTPQPLLGTIQDFLEYERRMGR